MILQSEFCVFVAANFLIEGFQFMVQACPFGKYYNNIDKSGHIIWMNKRADL